MLNQELHDAYRTTNYKVFTPEFTIKVGQLNGILNKILEATSNTSWAYITAFNPFSKELSDEENKSRQDELLKLVTKHQTYKGHGVDEKEEWPAEESVLILGITEEDAVKLGNKYEQNAIVVGSIYKEAILKS